MAGRTRWTPQEWLTVASAMLPWLDKGLTKINALRKAQKEALDEVRRREDSSLRQACAPADARRCLDVYIEKARQLPAKPLIHAEAEEPKSKGAAIFWTLREKALVARMVLWMRKQSNFQPLSVTLFEAQAFVLPAERRRTRSSILHNANNKKMFEEGCANIWVIESIPFNPLRKYDDPPVAEEPAQAAPVEPPEPKPPEAQPASLGEPAKAFGEAMAQALDVLLKAHTEQIIDRVYTRLTETSTKIGLDVAALIERGMRDTVHKLVEAELGPIPEKPAAAEVDESKPLAQAKPKLQVDVIGVKGSQIHEIKSQFNGHTELRFIDSKLVPNWSPSPYRYVVINTKFISHSVEDVLRAKHIKPIRVRGGAPAIINAIRELHQVEGVPQ